MTRYARFVLLTVLLVIALSLSSGVLIARAEAVAFTGGLIWQICERVK